MFVTGSVTAAGAANAKAGRDLGASRGIFDADGNGVNVHAAACGELDDVCLFCSVLLCPVLFCSVRAGTYVTPLQHLWVVEASIVNTSAPCKMVGNHAVPGAATAKAGRALGVSRGNFDDDGNAVNVHAVACGELYLHELPVRWTHYASQCLPLRQSPQGQPWRRRRTRTNERAWRARRDSRGSNSTQRATTVN